MDHISKLFTKTIHFILATSLSVIVILLFSNVVLRYIFNSGIVWAVEFSRILFVWMTFWGAILAFKENKHLAVYMFVKKLPQKLQMAIYIISQLLIGAVLIVVLKGSYTMFVLNTDTKSPATGLPLSVIYVMGLILSISILIMILINVIGVFSKKVNVTDVYKDEESTEIS